MLFSIFHLYQMLLPPFTPGSTVYLCIDSDNSIWKICLNCVTRCSESFSGADGLVVFKCFDWIRSPNSFWQPQFFPLAHFETVVYGLVWNSHRTAFAKGSVSHQFGPFNVSPRVTKWEFALVKRRILCLSGQDPFSYCFWFQQVVFNNKKTPSYLTCCIGKGLINKWTEVIIEDGIDHRMRDQWWSAVLILTVVVDEVKWLSELVQTCTLQDFHRADGVLLSC